MVGLLAPNRLNLTVGLSISSGRAVGFTLVRGVSVHHLFTPVRGVSPQTLKISVYSCARCLIESSTRIGTKTPHLVIPTTSTI